MNLFIPSRSRWLIPASMLVAPFAVAIEAPEDDAAPPAVAGENAPQAEAIPMQAKAFIGLVSGPIPELLSIHLGVRNGEGVLVRSVMPDGPAATAGIKTNDIIVSIDGKIALSPNELSEIIGSHQPGDKVKVGLIQEGKGTELVVTLGARPDALAQLPGARRQNIQGLDQMPEEMAERIREMIEGNNMHFQFNGEGLKLDQGLPDIQRDMDMLREQMKELRAQQEDMLKDGAPLGLNANTTIRLMDPEGSIELSTNNAESKLTVRDKDNKVQWEGPWTTDEDKAKAPEDIRKRAGGLNMNGGGFKFELHGR